MESRSRFAVPRLCTLLTALSLVLVNSGVAAQDPASSPAVLGDGEREAVVLRINQLLEQQYVYPAVGEQSAADLIARLQSGEFDDTSSPVAFAAQLTEALQRVSRDLHLRVRVRPPPRAQTEREDPALASAQAAELRRQRNYGFEKVEHLEGNVGYIDLRYFEGDPAAKPTAAAAMNFLANADAIIFDLRQNRGGSTAMIEYLSSWFFSEPTQLTGVYLRAGDRTDESWTHDDILGVKRPDVPLFVLTGSGTFSAAEAFSYDMLTSYLDRRGYGRSGASRLVAGHQRATRGVHSLGCCSQPDHGDELGRGGRHTAHRGERRGSVRHRARRGSSRCRGFPGCWALRSAPRAFFRGPWTVDRDLRGPQERVGSRRS